MSKIKLCPFDKKPCIGERCNIFDTYNAGPYHYDCSIIIIKDLLREIWGR